MAYFSNGSEGEVLQMQCDRCQFGEKACPIFLVQNLFNYDAVGNKTATEILDCLIKKSGECAMLELIDSDIWGEK